jgi:integrase
LYHDNVAGGAAPKQRPDELRCHCLIALWTSIPFQAIGQRTCVGDRDGTRDECFRMSFPPAAASPAPLRRRSDGAEGPGSVSAGWRRRPSGRNPETDGVAILVAFRHGLRAAELCDLRWDQVDFDGPNLHVRRVKNCIPSTHPLQGDEMRALRRLQREAKRSSPYVFVSERGGAPFTTAGFARMIERAAHRGLGLELKAHPHTLRHACGYALAAKRHDTRAIQQYLGHRSITSTAVYTALAPNRFKDFWRE